MAQVRQVSLGTLAPSQLTPEESAEYAAFTGTASEGYLMFLDQRRKTRTWVVGSATLAAGLGLLTGWLAWGRR
jgi:hypothetical protein